MKILIFTVLMTFLIIPQIAYGTEILADPQKPLFGPDDWIQIYIEVEDYVGGDLVWNATQPDGTVLDGILSNLQASKITHSITRDAFDGQFGTWQIQYEYKDAVKVIDVEVEQLVVSVTTDQISYLPGDVVILQFSTNYYTPIATVAEPMITQILDDDGLFAIPNKIEMKVIQSVIIQQFPADDLLRNNPFGLFHATITYYGIQVDAPFEIIDPSSATSIFLSSDKQLYSLNDPVELNIVMPNIQADSGTLTITLPSGQLITKTISVNSSLTRITLDDVDTSKAGIYLLQFEYGISSTIGSFEVIDESKENSDTSDMEVDITLNKSQYRPGETIQATISTNKLVDEQIIYWFEDSSGNQGSQFSFVNPASGTFTIPHTISVDFIHGPSKLHVKYGSAETFAIFFVAGDAMTPEEAEVTQYSGPEILLTIDDEIGNFSEIADISISPNLELFVVDSGDLKIKVFDINGNLMKTWGTFGNGEGQLSNPTSILAEKSLVHVSDAGNSKIITFDNDGLFILDWGYSEIADQSVQNPTDIAVDGDGIYYISDGNQNKILKFDATGTYVGEIIPLATAAAKFSSIESITTNGDDDIFFLSIENNRILHFLSNGGFSKSFGTEGQNNKQFQNPVSLQFGANNYLFVADSGNNRVLVLSTAGDYITKWGTSGNGPGQFSKMTGIDVDLNGDIWVADSSNNSIQKFASIFDSSKLDIPDLIRDNAKLWITDQITNTDFLTDIQSLVEDGILIDSSTEQSENITDKIPGWLKNNVGWWADGEITDSEYVNGIQYLIQQGLIKIS